MNENVKEVESKAPDAPKVEVSKVEAPPPAAPSTNVIVPEVTKEPTWHLSKEEWDANQTLMGTLAQKIPALEGISQALSPLVDAINDVTNEEQNPIKPKPWMRRKLWGKP